MVELLAPAGGMEALTAAVESGADAVYLSGKMFGARQSASNFTDEELAEGIKFAHLRGVAAYVTVNTLVDDNEMRLLADYLKYIYQIGADAIIVQDLGAAYLAREMVPDMPLHASTQMTVHNLDGVKFLADLGFKRIVLARELSLADIEVICRDESAAAVEIEIFAHGALCISYSGQCLMSSLIGARSGNRGRCAQPCRLPYTLVDAEGKDILTKADTGEYLLSPKDLNTLEILPQLIQAGVFSLKIEGRMKRPEYVAVAVDVYRRAIDSLQAGLAEGGESTYRVSGQDKKDITQIFNRDFTSAYLQGGPGREMMSDRRPNNRGVMAGRVLSYDKSKKTVSIKLEECLAVGDIIEVWVKVGGRVNIPVSSVLVDGKPRQEATTGEIVVLPCPKEVRQHDRAFKVFDKNLDERAKTFFVKQESKKIRRVLLDAEVAAKEGEPLTLKLKDSEGFIAEARTKFRAQKALSRPLTYETVSKQIGRLGNTVFEMRSLDVNIDGEIMVPVSEINEARREAIQKLEAARLARFGNRSRLSGKKTFAAMPAKKLEAARKPDLVVNVDDLKKMGAALDNGADIIMFGAENYSGLEIGREDYQTALEMVRQAGKKIIFSTPRIIREGEMQENSRMLEFFAKMRPDAVSAANIGVIYLLKKYSGLLIHGDYPLNIYNSMSVNFLAGLGLKSLTLSPELNFGQIEMISGRADVVLEGLVHGRLPLMISEYCIAGSFLSKCAGGKDKKRCIHGKYCLKDRSGEKFPVVTDQYCRMHVLNAKETSMLPHVGRLCRSGLGRIRIEGKGMDFVKVGEITGLYRELLDNKNELEYEQKIKNAESENITRSHYFRGVM